jgi:hypothetical protein
VWSLPGTRPIPLLPSEPPTRSCLKLPLPLILLGLSLAQEKYLRGDVIFVFVDRHHNPARDAPLPRGSLHSSCLDSDTAIEIIMTSVNDGLESAPAFLGLENFDDATKFAIVGHIAALFGKNVNAWLESQTPVSPRLDETLVQAYELRLRARAREENALREAPVAAQGAAAAPASPLIIKREYGVNLCLRAIHEHQGDGVNQCWSCGVWHSSLRFVVHISLHFNAPHFIVFHVFNSQLTIQRGEVRLWYSDMFAGAIGMTPMRRSRHMNFVCLTTKLMSDLLRTIREHPRGLFFAVQDFGCFTRAQQESFLQLWQGVHTILTVQARHELGVRDIELFTKPQIVAHIQSMVAAGRMQPPAAPGDRRSGRKDGADARDGLGRGGGDDHDDDDDEDGGAGAGGSGTVRQMPTVHVVSKAERMSGPTPEQLSDPTYTDREHECPRCRRRFEFKKGLTEHMRVVHGDKSLIPCTEPNCLVECAGRTALHNHVRVVHKNNHPIACKELGCKATPPGPQALHVHMRKVHGEKNLHCDPCNVHTASSSTMNVHLKSASHRNMMFALNLFVEPVTDEPNLE